MDFVDAGGWCSEFGLIFQVDMEYLMAKWARDNGIAAEKKRRANGEKRGACWGNVLTLNSVYG